MQVRVKKRKWPIIVIAVVIVCVAGYFLLPNLISKVSSSGAQAQSSTVSAEAALGDVVSSITATGNIVSGTSKVLLPYGVNVSSVLVSAGDSVKAGDAMAKVDSSSLADAITDAKSSLADVNTQLTAIKNKTTNSYYIYSNFKGTIQEIYAADGDEADSVVAKHGALMTIKLASGGIYKVINTVGTVSSVSVQKGDTVYSGSQLFKLKVPVATTSKATLKAQKVALIDLIEKLTALKTDGYIYASESGEVADVNVSAGTSLTKSADTPGTGTSDTDDAETAGTTETADAAESSDAAATDGTDDESAAASTAADAEDDSGYANEGVAFTISLSGKAEVTVSIDELDISAVKEGQDAAVELDALEGQTFEGKVTEVTDTADTSSGVANFTATIALDKADGMLAGMSATATIIKEKKENVLTIPLEAVQQYGEKLFVYTSTAADGTPSGETVIETGLSDGAVTEVTSGLAEGATIYYTKSTDSSSGSFGMRGTGLDIGGGPEMRAVTSGERPPQGGDSND